MEGTRPKRMKEINCKIVKGMVELVCSKVSFHKLIRKSCGGWALVVVALCCLGLFRREFPLYGVVKCKQKPRSNVTAKEY